MNSCTRTLLLATLLLLLVPALAATTPHSTRAQSAPGLTLTPAAGPAGSDVSISGFMDGVSATAAARPDQAARHAFVCWDACPDGLSFEAVPVQWSTTNPGAYTLSFTVPATSWLELDGVHQPAPGSYTIGVQCLTPPGAQLVGGCATQPANASATFTLTGPAPSACATSSCAAVQLNPAAATPGTLVQVSGFAPLAQHLINGTVCCWDLVVEAGQGAPEDIASLTQSSDGTLTGSFRAPLPGSRTAPLSGVPELEQASGLPYTLDLQTNIEGDTHGATGGTPLFGDTTISIVANGPRSANATLSGATFTLDPAPSWSSLAGTVPLTVQRSTPLSAPVVTADGGTPQRVAACVPGGVAVSADGGLSWSQLPIDGAEQAIAAVGYQVFPAPAADAAGASCLTAQLDAAHPDSLFVTFQTAKQQYGAPPIFNLGLVSSDGGASWQLVPAPAGDAPDGFGGFFAASDGIDVLFSRPSDDQGNAPTFDVESSTDGGQNWSAATLACPANGPCVRWGPAANTLGSCAMHEYPQALLASTDGGTSFAPPTWPATANGCDAQELVTLSSGSVLLLSGRADFPAVLSNDGGASWQAIALPLLPSENGFATQYPELQILPTGALLARGDSGWVLLPAGATSWCSVDGTILPADASGVRALGGSLWWFAVAQTGGPALPVAIDANALTCAAS